jgi:hypothetical protein
MKWSMHARILEQVKRVERACFRPDIADRLHGRGTRVLLARSGKGHVVGALRWSEGHPAFPAHPDCLYLESLCATRAGVAARLVHRLADKHPRRMLACVVDMQRDDASSVVEFYRQTGFHVTYMYRPEHPDGLVMVRSPQQILVVRPT